MITLIVYGNTGFILSITSGKTDLREPIGVPFMKVEISNGKRMKITDGIGVDVSKTPHEVILEDIPPSEIDQLKQTVADLTEIVLAGGM